MRDFTNIIRHSLLRLATILTTLFVGMTFTLITSAASAAEIKKVEIVKPRVVEIVKLPVINAAVKAIPVKVIKPAAKSDAGVNPFFFNRFFNPFNQGFFFNEEFD